MKLQAKSSKRTTDKDVTLNAFGVMLGFRDGIVLKPDDAAGTNSEISTSEMDINRGLEFINIHCNLVDDDKNYYEGHRSTVVASIPLPVHRRLKDTIEIHHDLGNRVSLSDGVCNRIKFETRDSSGKYVSIGKVLLECYIIK